MRERISVKELKPSRPVRFLYGTAFGGIILRLVTRRLISRIVGAYLDCRLSKGLIKGYIRRNGIDMTEYAEEKYKSFNAFFTRRIRPELRPFDGDSRALVSPCDAKLSVYNLEKDGKFHIKGFDYTAETLLGDGKLAENYYGGTCLVFRLTVTDYHRYRFFDGGSAEKSVFIKGRLHTVQPAALEKRRVFTENCREVTLLHTDNFGETVQVEVGAMMVGRIVNDFSGERFERGDEKGRFEFGGSTIVLLLKKDAAILDDEFWKNTAGDFETVVKCGEKIGVKP